MSPDPDTHSAERRVTAQEIADYRRDGVVVLRRALSPEWIRRGAEAMITERGEADGYLVAWRSPNGSGDSWMRYLPSRQNPPLRRFIYESPVARLAAEVMTSATASLVADTVFAREPGFMVPTDWHQDAAGLPVVGDQHCVIWTSFEPVSRELAVEFVRGSHLERKRFVIGAVAAQGLVVPDSHPVPDIESNRDSYDIVGWATEPGDLLAFHIGVLHGARGGVYASAARRILSMRWAGDDVRYTGVAPPNKLPDGEWAGLRPGDRVVSRNKPQVWPVLRHTLEEAGEDV